MTRRRPLWRRTVRSTARSAFIIVFGVPLLLASTAAAGFGLLLFSSLPGTVPEEKPVPVSRPTHIFDSQGNEIAVLREFDLTVPMTRDDVPEVLKNAVVASEDRKFWTHRGIDPEGLVRAAVANYREGEVVQGGSTITQQYVKTVYLSDERTLSRKLDEAVLATRLERELTAELGSSQAAKEEILFRYLNTIYFGGGAYGAGAAAQAYFHKDVKDLTISEAATLAGVIPSPSAFGPRDHIVLAEDRRLEVLGAMLEQGMITQLEYQDAATRQLWYLGDGPVAEGRVVTLVHPPPESGASRYPFFVDYVRQYLLDHYTPEQIYRGGLRVETTIDPHLQGLAEAAVGNSLSGTNPPLEMSLVSVEPSTGFVKALVGGRDFAASQVNLATGGTQGMQPGSSFKAFTLLAGLEAGFTPDTVYEAGAVYMPQGCVLSTCAIRNSEGGAAGPITLRQATAGSVNTYFSEFARDVGPNNIAEMAHRLGIDHFLDADADYDERITLGYTEVSPLDMAAAYSVVANHGLKMSATPVIKVTDPDGAVLEDNTSRVGQQVLNPAVADTATDLLRGPVENGTATAALSSFGRPAAGKTGTTNGNTNAWFVGFTPQLSTAVWMGHTDGLYPLRGIKGYGLVFGGDIPARTWNAFMKPAHDGVPVIDFPEPGPLPPPTGGAMVAARSPVRRPVPDFPADCDGSCTTAPSLPPAQSPASTTTTSTVPGAATTVPPASTSTTTGEDP